MGLKTFSFYDFKQRKSEDKKRFADAFDVDCEHPYKGFEALITTEVTADRLWSFLEAIRDAGENGNLVIPQQPPSDDQVRRIATEALAGHKGAGWASRLFEDSTVAELPATVTKFLSDIFAAFPKPAEPAPEVPAIPAPAAQGAAPGPVAAIPLVEPAPTASAAQGQAPNAAA